MSKDSFQGFIIFVVLLSIISFILILALVFLPYYPAASKILIFNTEKLDVEPIKRVVFSLDPNIGVESSNNVLQESSLSTGDSAEGIDGTLSWGLGLSSKGFGYGESDQPLEVVAEVTITEGDTIYEVLRGFGASPQEILSIVSSSKEVFDLKRITPGRVLRATFLDGSLKGLEYPVDDSNLLVIKSSSLGFSAFRKEIDFDRKIIFVKGEIRNSLYEDGLKAGLDPEIILALTDVFAWEIDFSVDLREEDSFKVLYEERSFNGEVVRKGPVMAAQILNQGKLFTAIYFKDGNGYVDYYDLESNSLRKQFLKSPLSYRRITSYFSKRRRHPILKTYRPHHGIDYAAPRGTPIAASGDGKIVFAGWKKGYGRFIVIKHNGTYSTAYGHLSRFAKGIKRGRYVKQGWVIGYVGSSGISTGPHLHYEFRVNGRSVNPLRIKFPSAQPVKKRFREDFKRVKEEFLNILDREEENSMVMVIKNKGE